MKVREGWLVLVLVTYLLFIGKRMNFYFVALQFKLFPPVLHIENPV